MPRLFRIVLVGVSLLLVAPAGAQSPMPVPKATPHDVYVSCYLMARDDGLLIDESKPYSPLTCANYGVIAIAQREGRIAGQPTRFCLPKGAGIDANPVREMALAYVDVYQRALSRVESPNGLTAYVSAMILRWPCEP
jgi:hypothetical protein